MDNKILKNLKQLKGQKLGTKTLHMAVKLAFSEAGVNEKINLILHNRNMKNILVAYENKDNSVKYMLDFREENGLVEILDVKILDVKTIRR